MNTTDTITIAVIVGYLIYLMIQKRNQVGAGVVAFPLIDTPSELPIRLTDTRGDTIPPDYFTTSDR